MDYIVTKSFKTSTGEYIKKDTVLTKVGSAGDNIYFVGESKDDSVYLNEREIKNYLKEYHTHCDDDDYGFLY